MRALRAKGWRAVAALLSQAACAAATGSGAAWTLADVASTLDQAAGAADQGADPAVDVAAQDVAAQDVGADVGADLAAPVQTSGAQTKPALAAATFSQVVDSTGAQVAPSDLQGHWTVLWFYPAASTIG